jgi:TetR/AcrR family transcriptional regulator, lmrAB and yxaGH operons repressor
MARMIAERADVVPVLAEVFRTHGFEGASLSVIAQATGLGKGSLYNFFPGGKDEMAAAVLAHIDGWFAANVFEPLRNGRDPQAAIAAMFGATAGYFDDGGRVCVVGLFALADTRDRFADAVNGYFQSWIEALAAALRRGGHARAAARDLAEETVGGIQGGLVLARALGDTAAFRRTMARLQARLASPVRP